MNTFDQLIQHRRDFDVAQFSELEYPCSPKEDAFMTVGTALLALAPVLIVIAFLVL
jgi:hypothetical protein